MPSKATLARTASPRPAHKTTAPASPPAKPATKSVSVRAKSPPTRLLLMVATRKGAWLFESDAKRKTWAVRGPHFLGHTISHVMLDPRDGRTLLAAAKTGHLGPTIFRSTNLGRSWAEAKQPPAFAQPAPATAAATPAADAPVAQAGSAAAAALQPPPLPARSVDHTFWLTPGHASQPGAWYAGTSPQGLFRSDDGGASWAPLPGLNDNPQYRGWMGAEQDGTPDGPKLHSLIVDPRDPAHLYLAMSSGGVHESTDAGQNWAPLIEGMEVVGGFDVSNVTFHDPHCVRLCPSQPDRLYQQNHCGIYRLDRPGTQWQRIGRKMPKRVGDVGFPMVVHPHDADIAWVFPMDGTDVWPRTSPAGQPATYVTRNGGKTWQRQDQGLPGTQAWWTVKRQAMTADAQAVPAVYLGTTSGELWIGDAEGERWRNIARHLPEIYAVEVAELAA